MFHRVLPEHDPRWPGSDPDYTLRLEHFQQCLRFCAAHYNIVSLAQVLQARRGLCSLPRCALLLTFDDGWADTVEHALPALQARQLPAVVFVASDAVGHAQAFFQERLMAAWRRGGLSLAELSHALRTHGAALAPDDAGHAHSIEGLIAAMAAMPATRREDLLSALAGRIEDGLVHMMSVGQLAQAQAGAMAVGTHGRSHAPLTTCGDLAAELEGARDALAKWLPDGVAAPALSFPHGQYDALIVQRTRQAGYELAFTSDPAINLVHQPLCGLLARLDVTTHSMTTAAGRFHPGRLAMNLFFRSHVRLQ